MQVDMFGSLNIFLQPSLVNYLCILKRNELNAYVLNSASRGFISLATRNIGLTSARAELLFVQHDKGKNQFDKWLLVNYHHRICITWKGDLIV